MAAMGSLLGRACLVRAAEAGARGGVKEGEADQEREEGWLLGVFPLALRSSETKLKQEWERSAVRELVGQVVQSSPPRPANLGRETLFAPLLRPQKWAKVSGPKHVSRGCPDQDEPDVADN